MTRAPGAVHKRLRAEHRPVAGAHVDDGELEPDAHLLAFVGRDPAHHRHPRDGLGDQTFAGGFENAPIADDGFIAAPRGGEAERFGKGRQIGFGFIGFGRRPGRHAGDGHGDEMFVHLADHRPVGKSRAGLDQQHGTAALDANALRGFQRLLNLRLGDRLVGAHFAGDAQHVKLAQFAAKPGRTAPVTSVRTVAGIGDGAGCAAGHEERQREAEEGNVFHVQVSSLHLTTGWAKRSRILRPNTAAPPTAFSPPRAGTFFPQPAFPCQRDFSATAP